MNIIDEFNAAKRALDVLDDKCGHAIDDLTLALKDYGVAIPFLAADAPPGAVWWSKRSGSWRFEYRRPGSGLDGIDLKSMARHVRRQFATTATIDGLLEAATRAYQHALEEAEGS